MRRSTCRKVGALTVLVLVAACSSGSSPDRVAGVDVTETAPAASTSVASTTAASSSTTLSTTVPVPAGVVVGSGIDSESYRNMRTVAVDNAFLELTTSPDGRLVVSRSTDEGSTWSATTTELHADGVALTATNGHAILLSTGFGSAAGAPPEVSASSDAGATWTTSELPVPAAPSLSPYVITDTSVSAIAAGDDVAMAVGAVMHRIDWRRYSIEVLGVDHGNVVQEGGFPAQWTVEFEDGEHATVDLTEFGLGDAGAGATTVGWLGTTSGWDIVDLPFINVADPAVKLVAGPGGFLIMPNASVPLIGVDGAPVSATPRALLYHSADGRTWQASEPPADVGAAGGFLVGGPLGYVIIGETNLWFSADGLAWSRVAEFADPDPTMYGFLSLYPPAAGPAGFAVAIGSIVPSAKATVLSSRDGADWEPVPLPAGTFDAMVAVSSDAILVRPVVSTTTSDTVVPVDTSVITGDVGGAGGLRPAAMCEAPELVMVAAYDLETGAYRWHRCGTSTHSVLEAITDDRVYVREASSVDKVSILDAATGDDLGSIPLAQLAAELPADAALPMKSPLGTTGVRLTGGQDDALVATDTATGAKLWSVSDHLAYDDVWAVGDGAVFMGHDAGVTGTTWTWTVRAYELETGEIRWESETSNQSYPWWVADGRVFSIWTELTVLSTTTGEVLWATEYGTTDFPGMRSVLANDHTVVVTFASEWGDGD